MLIENKNKKRLFNNKITSVITLRQIIIKMY